jgi:hypothetical protein
MRELSSENQFYTGFASPFWVLIAAGIALGRLYTETWDKPNFYSLPRQVETSKKILLFFGLVVSTLLSLSVNSFFPWMTNGIQGTSILLICYYLMWYWFSVIIAYHFYRAAVVFVSISYFIFPIISQIGLWHLINSFLLAHVFPSTLGFFTVNILLYRFFGKKLKIEHSNTLLSFKTFFQKDFFSAARNASGIYQAKAGLIKMVDSFFYSRIKNGNFSTIYPHLSGRIYIIITSMISKWKIILFLNLFFFLIGSIFVNRYNTINLLPLFFSLFGILAGYMCMVPKSDIFFPFSRKGRFWVETTTVITAILIALVFAFIIVYLSKIIPDEIIIFIFGPDPNNFISFNFKYVVFTVLFLPATSAFIKIFRGKIILSAVSMTAFAVGLSCIYFFTKNNWADFFSRYQPFPLIVAIIVSFGFYFLTIYYDSFKRSFY